MWPTRPCADHAAGSYSSFLLFNPTPWSVSPYVSPLWAARSIELGCVSIVARTASCEEERERGVQISVRFNHFVIFMAKKRNRFTLS
jgi:hypothetical protein